MFRDLDLYRRDVEDLTFLMSVDRLLFQRPPARSAGFDSVDDNLVRLVNLTPRRPGPSFLTADRAGRSSCEEILSAFSSRRLTAAE